ncbi:hypothetical protein EHV15_34125 [Paenibacillus oralis]|uniref:Uncharacterized protein n=1 Tax=Paenibacillus oralis TaxID=2490856 RepID=A0A3P3T9B1_9BACL|nr:hypothetical protein [Paenibacillus oralis]RRJ54636.1 hypothetical protein EHV15_34125 [Paenibacillus oralis]
MPNYVVEDETQETCSMIYDRPGFSPWVIEVVNMKNEDMFTGVFRTAFSGGRECEQFVLMPAKADFTLLTIQIFKNGDVLFSNQIPATVEVKKQKKRIVIQSHADIEVSSSGTISILTHPSEF